MDVLFAMAYMQKIREQGAALRLALSDITMNAATNTAMNATTNLIMCRLVKN
jgi:hypothetical protein